MLCNNSQDFSAVTLQSFDCVAVLGSLTAPYIGQQPADLRKVSNLEPASQLTLKSYLDHVVIELSDQVNVSG